MTSILYLGGTGTISAACVRRSIERGHDVTVVNRGNGRRGLPDEVTVVSADIRDAEALTAALDGREFDAVADFLSFSPADVARGLSVFEGRTAQYIFISSASAYQKPPAALPITERTPLENPFWQYSRDKISCEELLLAASADRDLPVTIVRPSHTYDAQSIPTMGGWTDIARMREGRPVVVHGDGTSLWTITHSDDFAVAFTGLVGRPEAIGEDYTITGSHAPTWNQIYGWLADAAGVEAPELVHVASETIGAIAPDLLPTLAGDKAHTIVFDTAKVQALVPEFETTITFDEGARRILAHYDAHPEDQVVDAERDAQFDRMVAHARSAA